MAGVPNPPGNKVKIYAYIDAFNKPSKEGERNYNDADLWNLNHEYLDPLRDYFLGVSGNE
jgi:hypothetical protein